MDALIVLRMAAILPLPKRLRMRPADDILRAGLHCSPAINSCARESPAHRAGQEISEMSSRHLLPWMPYAQCMDALIRGISYRVSCPGSPTCRSKQVILLDAAQHQSHGQISRDEAQGRSRHSIRHAVKRPCFAQALQKHAPSYAEHVIASRSQRVYPSHGAQVPQRPPRGELHGTSLCSFCPRGQVLIQQFECGCVWDHAQSIRICIKGKWMIWAGAHHQIHVILRLLRRPQLVDCMANLPQSACSKVLSICNFWDRMCLNLSLLVRLAVVTCKSQMHTAPYKWHANAHKLEHATESREVCSVRCHAIASCWKPGPLNMSFLTVMSNMLSGDRHEQGLCHTTQSQDCLCRASTLLKVFVRCHLFDICTAAPT